jgi:hypothetical protein
VCSVEQESAAAAGDADAGAEALAEKFKDVVQVGGVTYILLLRLDLVDGKEYVPRMVCQLAMGLCGDAVSSEVVDRVIRQRRAA